MREDNWRISEAGKWASERGLQRPRTNSATLRRDDQCAVGVSVTGLSSPPLSLPQLCDCVWPNCGVTLGCWSHSLSDANCIVCRALLGADAVPLEWAKSRGRLIFSQWLANVCLHWRNKGGCVEQRVCERGWIRRLYVLFLQAAIITSQTSSAVWVMHCEKLWTARFFDGYSSALDRLGEG